MNMFNLNVVDGVQEIIISRMFAVEYPGFIQRHFELGNLPPRFDVLTQTITIRLI